MSAPETGPQQTSIYRRRRHIHALGILAGALVLAAMYRGDRPVWLSGVVRSVIVVVGPWIGRTSRMGVERSGVVRAIALIAIGLLGSIDVAEIARTWVVHHVTAGSPVRILVVAGSWSVIWVLISGVGLLLDRRADRRPVPIPA